MTRSQSHVSTPRRAGLLRLLCWAQMVFWALSLIQPFLGVDAVSYVLWRLVPPISLVSVALALFFGLTAGFVMSGRRWARVMGLVASMAGLLYALLLGSTLRTSMLAAAAAAMVTLMLLLNTDMRSSDRR
ncbi:hypothetical protein [Nonomuraea wenchangensis]|uniref:hypothetical protein n=1 Tax=Nonomuraea wenchangensis TaxID=568860 RepID=UPI00333064A6